MSRFSLNTKISLVVSLLVATLMVGLSYWIISHFDRRFKESIASQQIALISERAQDIDETIQRIQKVIIAKAKCITSKDVKNPIWTQQKFNENPELVTIFDNGVFLFSSSGVVIAEIPNKHSRGIDFSYREYFKKTMERGKPCISKPYFSSQTHHHPVVMFTAPVFAKDGKTVAVVGGSIDLLADNFLGHNALLKIGKTGYAYLYDTDRTILMHPDRKRILQQDVPVGVNRVFDKGIAGFEGTEVSDNSRGLLSLVTVKHLKSVNWILGANYPVADAYAPTREATLHAIIAVVGGIMLSMLIVWRTTMMLTAPLLQLTNYIRGISEQGGRGQEIRIDSADEIGELAATFNHMMRTITSKQEELQKLSRAVEQSASLVAITDLSGNIEYVNPKFCELTGYGLDEVIGQNLRILKSGDMPAEMYREQWETITSGRDWQGEFHNKKKNGEMFWAGGTISPIKNEKGIITHFSCVQEDITERRGAEVKLRHLSTHDILTGLYNRAFFEEEMARLALSRRFPVSIVTADVDGLKGINDSLGHEAGDRLLKLAACALFDAFRAEDVVARIGGDEFGVLLPGADAQVVAEVIKRVRKRQEEINGTDCEFSVSISLGAATAHTAEKLSEAMKLSDERMYQEKSTRKKS